MIAFQLVQGRIVEIYRYITHAKLGPRHSSNLVATECNALHS